MKKLIVIGMLFVLLISLTGCGQSAIIGQWESDVEGTFTFSKDNQVTHDLWGIISTGTYKLDDNKITVQIQNFLTGEINSTMEYAIEGDTLTMNGIAYQKVDDK